MAQPDVNVRFEAGHVILELLPPKVPQQARIALSRREAQRIAGALNVCASTPAGVDEVNFEADRAIPEWDDRV